MKFSSLQLSIVLVLIIGTASHTVVLPTLLYVAKRDAWICTIISYGVLLAWGMLLYLIMKKMNNQKLFDYLSGRVGNFTSGIVLLFSGLYVTFIGITCFYDLMQTVKVYFLPRTPLWIIAICFLLLCVGVSTGGLKTITNMSIFLLPLVLLLELAILLATLKAKDYSLLFPVMIHGTRPIIKGTLVALGANLDLLFLIFIRHQLYKSFSKFHLSMLLTLLGFLMFLLVTGAITGFGPNVGANLRFPAFEQWRLITFGNYFTHIDFLAVFYLLAGMTVKVSMCLLLLTEMMKESPLKRIGTYLIVSVFFFAIFILNDIKLQEILESYIYPNLFYYGVLISLIIIFISYLPERKGATS